MERIKSRIEKLLDVWKWHSSTEAKYRCEVYKELLEYINSSQEEHVSNDLEEAAWLQYDRNKPLMPPELDLHKELIDFFKAGVRWKEQNDSNLSEMLGRDNLDEMAEEYSSCTYLEEVLGEGDREVLKARLKSTFKAGAKWGIEQAEVKIQAQSMALAHGCPKEPVSEDLEEAADNYVGHAPEIDEDLSCFTKRNAFIAGAKWKKGNLWKNAQGDDLPEIDREVIVLYQPYQLEGSGECAVGFAHRPPERWYGRNLDGEEHVFEPKTYNKGEWNIPNVVWWLDLDLPKEEK